MLPSAVTSALVTCWLKISGSSAGTRTKPASSAAPTRSGIASGGVPRALRSAERADEQRRARRGP